MVAVPVSFEDTAIPIPVTRNGKPASSMACVVADGRALILLIVIPRKAIDLDLYALWIDP
jgi:hypothetical protein